MAGQTNNEKDFQTETDTFESILKKIHMYKNSIKQSENFIKAQLGLSVRGVVNVLSGNNKPILLHPTKELLSNTKKNLTEIENALDSEKLKTMSGVRQVQRLIARSIEDIDEQYKRVVSNNEPVDVLVATVVLNYCKDTITQFIRFAEDLLTNVYNYFAYHNNISDKNEKLEQALSNNQSSMFKTSLATMFKNEQEVLKSLIRGMRDHEETILQYEGCAQRKM